MSLCQWGFFMKIQITLFLFQLFQLFSSTTNFFISAISLFLYYRADAFITESILFTKEPISLLQSYRVDFFTTLLLNRFLYYRATEPISLLQNGFLYCRMDFFTTGRFLYFGIDFFDFFTSELQNRFLYYKVDFVTSESISLLQNLQNRFLYYISDVFTTESIFFWFLSRVDTPKAPRNPRFYKKKF